MAVHAGLLFYSIRCHSVVVDEVGHIPSGLSHWQTGRFAAYRVNPPLGRMLATLPVLLAAPKLDLRGIDEQPGARPEWRLGILFASANAPRYHDLVCLARLAGIGWSLAGLWLVARLARELYGELAGCVAAAWWCFDPMVLAFAGVVTPDVPAMVAGLAFVDRLRAYLRDRSWPHAWQAGVVLGIALLTKFTMLVLLEAVIDFSQGLH